VVGSNIAADYGLSNDSRQAPSAQLSNAMMKSQKDRMLAGELYEPLDDKLTRARQHAREIVVTTHQFLTLPVVAVFAA
jgi:alpha-D-ribose 1-methylphosphonate 5-triphosphate synthase subunit PhnG